MKRFTDRYIKALKTRDERYDVFEGHGFGMRVFPSGVKTWVHLYTSPTAGRRRRRALGNYPDTVLAEAREVHAQDKALLRKGVDPQEVHEALVSARRAAPTVSSLAAEYLEKWAKPRKRSWKEDERQLNKDILPIWGSSKVEDITRRDVRAMIEAVAERGSPIAANRLLAVVRKLFNFAIDEDWIDLSPVQRIKPVVNEKERAKDRVLSTSEIQSLWKHLSGSAEAASKPSDGDSTRRALKLILATAQRPGEVLNLKKSEIEGDWWTIPGTKTKNKLAHRVPLSSCALEIIGTRSDDIIFPSPRNKDKAVWVEALSKTVLRNFNRWGVEKFTPHDLRRTAASHMTGMGIPRLVVQRILNHAEQGVTAVYDRHSYDKEKKDALDAWAQRLDKIISCNDLRGG